MSTVLRWLKTPNDQRKRRPSQQSRFSQLLSTLRPALPRKRFQPNAYARKKRDEKDPSSLEEHLAEVVVRAGRSGGKSWENLDCQRILHDSRNPDHVEPLTFAEQYDGMQWALKRGLRTARCMPSYCSAKVRDSTWRIPAICPEFQPNIPRLSSSLLRFRNSSTLWPWCSLSWVRKHGAINLRVATWCLSLSCLDLLETRW